MSKAKVLFAESGSIAEEIGIEKGDIILDINDIEIEDILDYKFASSDDVLKIHVQKTDGTEEIIEVETDYEELGIVFENSLLDEAKSCKNKCIFCFIDQLPKGMRETVYFKDDDARLSFLQGNYITLTNLSDKDINRIIRMHISPVNISVHATEPALRCKLLSNRFAGGLFEIMKRLAKNEIMMNCQIVLCPDINDKEHLDRSITDLSSLFPYVNSLSVVPVGLTAYRDGLYPLKSFDEKSSAQVIDQVESYQKMFLKKFGKRIVFLSDEFYIMAHRPLPPASEYENFYQIENGVGLISNMREEFYDAISELPEKKLSRTVSVATGEIAYDFICELSRELEKKAGGLKINVYKIKNNFFGGKVTVTGLLTAKDLIEQLRGKKLGKRLYISKSMLRADDDVFLDDMHIAELSNKLSVPVIPVANDGYEFAEKILED